MRPRWELKNDNHYAAIISKKPPYGLLLKLTDRLITDMRGTDNEPVDDRPVGYVVHPVTGRYEPAELIDDETFRFLHYINAADPAWQAPNALANYTQQMINWGQGWAQRSAPMPANIEALIDEEEDEPAFDPPVRNRRGKSQRRSA